MWTNTAEMHKEGKTRECQKLVINTAFPSEIRLNGSQSV